ncbi:(R)-mandelonitrile lyase [Frondihabitans australicus]|uniref:Quercetin dioxygenase-like cupin family protein n=1 Tax=Frondihabitans australicus TaxID=386892 RepID=A0A495IIG7_9MICO|nr:cupin domain-containing protein [Frondihabitans australicus]RKR75787.1 quercetin dioxygenase-like cupin family protein [Frondihabitans australicus]
MTTTPIDQPTMQAGPSDWFDGVVHIDVVGTPGPASRVMAGLVHFAPAARTAWHTHPNGQTLYVTEGVSVVQVEGERAQELRAGDRVVIPAGANHWHGAAPARLTTQLAYQEADAAGEHTTWGRPVTDEEYAAR